MNTRRWTARLSALVLAGTLAACGAAPTQPAAGVAPTPTIVVAAPTQTAAEPLDEVAQQRQQWTDQKVTNYRFTIERSCFCTEEARGPALVEVSGEEATSVTNVASGQPSGEFFEQVNTIGKLFATIDEAKTSGADEVVVTYDEKYGFPLTIKIDQDFQMADEESYYTISNFEVVQ